MNRPLERERFRRRLYVRQVLERTGLSPRALARRVRRSPSTVAGWLRGRALGPESYRALYALDPVFPGGAPKLRRRSRSSGETRREAAEEGIAMKARTTNFDNREAIAYAIARQLDVEGVLIMDRALALRIIAEIEKFATPSFSRWLAKEWRAKADAPADTERARQLAERSAKKGVRKT